jgi:hypothetical protein
MQCQQPFSEEDIVVLNGTAKDLELMRTKLEARQAHIKAEKKARNDTKHKGKANTTATSTETSSNSQDSTKKSSGLSHKVHGPEEETKAFANGEEGRQKLKKEKLYSKLLPKPGNKLNGMLMASN